MIFAKGKLNDVLPKTGLGWWVPGVRPVQVSEDLRVRGRHSRVGSAACI